MSKRFYVQARCERMHAKFPKRFPNFNGFIVLRLIWHEFCSMGFYQNNANPRFLPGDNYQNGIFGVRFQLLSRTITNVIMLEMNHTQAHDIDSLFLRQPKFKRKGNILCQFLLNKDVVKRKSCYKSSFALRILLNQMIFVGIILLNTKFHLNRSVLNLNFSI